MLSRVAGAMARAVTRRWWLVLLFWAVALGVLLVVAPPFRQVAAFDEGAFLSEDAPAIEGGQLLAEGWPDDSFTRNAAIVIERDGGGLRDADRQWARRLIDWFESGEAPAEFGQVTTHLRDRDLRSSLASDDGRAMILLVGLQVAPFSPEANEAVAAAREHIGAADRPGGLSVHLTGTAGTAADEAAAIESSVNRTHVITIVLVIAILLWIYRSPVAPLVPLATIGVAYGVSLSVVSLLGAAGMTVSSLYETFAIVIVFGAGTDYCLFLISRYHEELERGRAAGLGVGDDGPVLRHRTLTATLVVLAAVIGSSAMTTVAGFSAQSVSDFGMYRSMGPAMALTVLITLVTALTLAPALMRMLGGTLFWPHRGVRGVHGDTDDQPLVERHRALVGAVTPGTGPPGPGTTPAGDRGGRRPDHGS